MISFKIALPMCHIAFGNAALAQDVDCTKDDYLEAAMSNLEKPDGKWGISRASNTLQFPTWLLTSARVN